MVKSFLSVLLLIMVSLCFAVPVLAGSAEVEWGAAEGSMGTKIYYGADTGLRRITGDLSKYDGVGADLGPSPVDVGPALTARLELSPEVPTTYYFIAVGYDERGSTGPVSNQISKVMTSVGPPTDLQFVPLE